MNTTSFSLEGRVAIVTGGGTGIGKAIAMEFAKTGADIIVCGRRPSPLEEVATEIKNMGKRCLAIPSDISKRDDVDNLFKIALDAFGTIDILVNNAGLILKSPVCKASEDDWDKVMNTNLKGTWYCCQVVAKEMIKHKKGNIINISSISGISTCGGISSIYCVSKAGVIMLTRCLAWELGPYSIRVNCIAPGSVKTPGVADQWKDSEGWKRTASNRPLGRLPDSEEISGIAVFLASDASSNITGQTIVADGGLLA